MDKTRYFKRSLGQNFLIDNNIKSKIVQALEIKSGNENVIEVGPGNGALTEKIVLLTNSVILVEKDDSLIDELKSKFPNLQIINQDFLDWEFPKDLKNINIIGNLPYNIASQIIFKVLRNSQIFTKAIFMVQKEVAERITSKNTNKDYSLLSVICQTFSNPIKLFNVSPNCFFPKPKVTSTVLKFEIKKEDIPDNFDLFLIFCKSLFYTKRKKLLNTLKQNPFLTYNSKFFEYLEENFDKNIRISDIPKDDILKAYNYYTKIIDNPISK